MRRLAVLTIVALLGIIPVEVGGGSALAQGTPEDPVQELENCSPGDRDPAPWVGVCVPLAPETELAPPPLGGNLVMQPYSVLFARDFAATEAIQNQDSPSEFMVVIVRSGTFALDIDPSIHPATEAQIVTYAAGGQIPTLTPYSATAPHYELDGGSLKNEDGATDCTSACPIEPGVPVQLGPGDIAVADAGAPCIYCLLDGNGVADDETGVLDVFVLLGDQQDVGDFSWIRDWEMNQGDAQGSRLDPSVTLGWALFHPAPNCRGGG